MNERESEKTPFSEEGWIEGLGRRPETAATEAISENAMIDTCKQGNARRVESSGRRVPSVRWSRSGDSVRWLRV